MRGTAAVTVGRRRIVLQGQSSSGAHHALLRPTNPSLAAASPPAVLAPSTVAASCLSSCYPAPAIYIHRPLDLRQEVKLPSISGTVIANSNLNLLGMGATIISLQVGAVRGIGGRHAGLVGGLSGVGTRAACPAAALLL